MRWAGRCVRKRTLRWGAPCVRIWSGERGGGQVKRVSASCWAIPAGAGKLAGQVQRMPASCVARSAGVVTGRPQR